MVPAAAGGGEVRSTCSLNPLEDEAVVAAALAAAGPARARLLPLPALDGVRAAPGVGTWRVCARGRARV